MSSCPACLSDTNPGTQCPEGRLDLPYFAEIVINHNLIIPEPKPDVELIANVTKNFKIEDVEILEVDLGNTEGRKLIIAGTLTLGFEYSAAVPSQEVHFAHFDIPFEAIIKGRPCPGLHRGLLPPDFNLADYAIRICVEHEQYHLVSPREISKVLVVLIWLEPPDLAVTKVDDPDPVKVNGLLTYTVTVTNNGPVRATGVTLADLVDPSVVIDAASVPPYCTVSGQTITCTLGTLPAGARAEIAFNVVPGTVGEIVNTAWVTGDQPDVYPNNNKVEVFTTVEA